MKIHFERAGNQYVAHSLTIAFVQHYTFAFFVQKNVIVKVKAVVQKEILSKTELQKWHCCRRSKKIQLMIIVEQEESHMISSNFMASTF